jgi:DNA-binding MarR family transcriptional regulator
VDHDIAIDGAPVIGEGRGEECGAELDACGRAGLDACAGEDVCAGEVLEACAGEEPCAGGEAPAVELDGLDAAGRLRFLVAQTARFSASFLRWVDAHTSGEGLTYPRLRLLEILHCGGPAIMRDLAGQLGMTARNMTATVDALEDAGLAHRRPHPSDRRATLVELTPAGLCVAESTMASGLATVAAVFDTLSEAEQQQFVSTIRRLSAAMYATPPRN